jgi:hypothetical protein
MLILRHPFERSFFIVGFLELNDPSEYKIAACFPSNSAVFDCKASTVGSISITSSPTSARSIASRIAGVGLVTVSLRKSIMAEDQSIGNCFRSVG